MKIRFRKDTVRYRLDKMDINRLDEEGFCEEKTAILPGDIIFSLSISEDNNKSISFEPPYLKLEVPAASMDPVIEGDQVGFECNIQGTGDSVVEVLVERDFKCLTEDRGKEDAHAFEHPLADSSLANS
jgi:hypothetical protein